MPLTSTHNPLLQKIRRAVEQGRPLEDGSVVAEGPHLLAEALTGEWEVADILCSSAARERHSRLLEGRTVTEVGDHAFAKLSATEQTQGVLCVLRPKVYGWAGLLGKKGPLVVLDGIQDPGNAGTIVRSCEAFGGSGVVFTEGCVRISNGKFLRATAGSLFRNPFLADAGRAEVVQKLAESGRTTYALALNGKKSLFEVDLRDNVALIVGNEGAGVSAELQKASLTLSIPTRKVESLNAAVACSIALFEAARQLGGT